MMSEIPTCPTCGGVLDVRCVHDPHPDPRDLTEITEKDVDDLGSILDGVMTPHPHDMTHGEQ